MLFGLKNAPVTFQRMMYFVLRDFIKKSCAIYMDDVSVFWKKIYITKYIPEVELIELKNILYEETKFLGHAITMEDIKPNPLMIKSTNNLIC